MYGDIVGSGPVGGVIVVPLDPPLPGVNVAPPYVKPDPIKAGDAEIAELVELLVLDVNVPGAVTTGIPGTIVTSSLLTSSGSAEDLSEYGYEDVYSKLKLAESVANGLTVVEPLRLLTNFT